MLSEQADERDAKRLEKTLAQKEYVVFEDRGSTPPIQSLTTD